MTYKIQIDDEVRDATPQEIAEIESRHAQALAEKEAESAKAEAKAGLLARLGLSEDEFKTLIS